MFYCEAERCDGIICTRKGQQQQQHQQQQQKYRLHVVSTTNRLTEASSITATDIMSTVVGTDTPTVTYSVALSPSVPETHIIT